MLILFVRLLPIASAMWYVGRYVAPQIVRLAAERRTDEFR